MIHLGASLYSMASKGNTHHNQHVIYCNNVWGSYRSLKVWTSNSLEKQRYSLALSTPGYDSLMFYIEMEGFFCTNLSNLFIGVNYLQLQYWPNQDYNTRSIYRLSYIQMPTALLRQSFVCDSDNTLILLILWEGTRSKIIVRVSCQQAVFGSHERHYLPPQRDWELKAMLQDHLDNFSAIRREAFHTSMKLLPTLTWWGITQYTFCGKLFICCPK